jgi:hypothetical protein
MKIINRLGLVMKIQKVFFAVGIQFLNTYMNVSVQMIYSYDIWIIYIK